MEDAEGPGEDEIALYEKLHGEKGWSVGVHDPDWMSPLEGDLHVERTIKGASLRLECEDESLSFTRLVTQLHAEKREDLTSGFGVAFIEVGGGEGHAGELRAVVLESEKDRETFLSVLEQLRSHPRRAFHRRTRSAAVGCLPCAPCGAPGGRPRTRRISFSAPPGTRASASNKPPAEVGLHETWHYVKQEWEKMARPIARSGSISRLASGGSDKKGAAEPRRLDSQRCALLLRKLLGLEEEPSSQEPDAGLAALFPGAEGAVALADFWALLEPLLLLDRLKSDRDELLRKHFEGKSFSMKLEAWRLFLVKVQDEDGDAIERLEARLQTLAEPDVSADKRFTLLGLTRFLCSMENSLLDPQCLQVTHDMSRPLTDYWIAAAHHVYLDPSPPAAGRETLADGDPAADERERCLAVFRTALRAGLRCLELALVADGGGRTDAVRVMLQRKRLPLADVLAVVREHLDTDDTPFPVLLVLHVALLPLPTAGQIPDLLQQRLGGCLWQAPMGRPGWPSPADAKGRAIVIVGPGDGCIDLDPLGTLGRAEADGREGADAAEATLRAAEERRFFAAFPGRELDRTAADDRTEVGFMASDELQALGQEQVAELIQHQAQHLSVAYPLASRRAPANFNLAQAWAAGVQLAPATLGSRCSDVAALAHLGRFAQDNGGCGYVLKPPHLRQSSGAPSPLKLELRFLAARAPPGAQGALPVGPVALIVYVFGQSEDCARRAYRPAMPKGPLLLWPEASSSGDSAPMAFEVRSPAAAVLALELVELDAEVPGPARLGCFAAPVSGLRHGLRWVPLWQPSGTGEVLPTQHGALSGLLVHANIKRDSRRRQAP